MSRINELINELCPNGVKYMELGEILDYEQPSKYIVKSTDYNQSFKTPVLTAGQSFILGYTNEVEGIYNATKDKPVIIFDDFTTSFHLVDFKFKVKSSAMKMLIPKETENINFKYVYYAMKNIRYAPLDHTRQWIGKYSKRLIPVPPIEVQLEIVRILDELTELNKKLTEELKAEIEARNKQYEYYRDKLLTFKKMEE
ncbi:restriction endonuclease subunit S (plasmid) [Clostridium perfringens]